MFQGRRVVVVVPAHNEEKLVATVLDTMPELVDRIIVVHDYQVTDVYDPFSGPNANSRCVKSEQGELNKFQFTLSKNRIEVFATDFGGGASGGPARALVLPEQSLSRS